MVDKETCIGCHDLRQRLPVRRPAVQPDGRQDGQVRRVLHPGNGADAGATTPHCVATCPTQALHFGPIEEMEALAAEKGGARLKGGANPCTFIA